MLQKTDAVAKPARVASELERDILSGKLQFGAQLASEHELVRRFSVSRTSIRKGLEALAGKGLIATHVGIGSFVTFNGQTIDNALGWTRALAKRKEHVETQLLRLEVSQDRPLARLLKLKSADFIDSSARISVKERNRRCSTEAPQINAIQPPGQHRHR